MVDGPKVRVDEGALRALVPRVLAGLVRRGEDFDAAEDALQEALLDDTLFLLFCCCSPELSPASQVALTLRAVGGLTTREIADAFYVPEATMAQRISRAKRTLRGRRLDRPGDLAVVLRVLYLIYAAGHADRVDLAREAIRLTRRLTSPARSRRRVGCSR
jgi:predicted RNA polymerase sigma factor